MPRTIGVSSRSTTWWSFRRPSPRTVARWSSVQPMTLPIILTLTVPAAFAALLALAMSRSLPLRFGPRRRFGRRRLRRRGHGRPRLLRLRLGAEDLLDRPPAQVRHPLRNLEAQERVH